MQVSLRIWKRAMWGRAVASAALPGLLCASVVLFLMGSTVGARAQERPPSSVTDHDPAPGAAAAGSSSASEEVQAGVVAAGAGPHMRETSADMDQVTPEREAAALTFARRHHPELAELLTALKNMDQGRYEQAIQELFRTSEQLARLQSRLPDRYTTDLEIWKIDSRIRLLVARSPMVDPEQSRAEIKKLLLDRTEVRLQQYAGEREKLLARIAKLDSTVSSLRNHSVANAEKEADRLLKSVGPARQRTTRTPDLISTPQ